jgi:hypothetical protein
MGGLTEVLVVALGSGGSVTVLAKSISAYLSIQRSNITIHVRNARGSELELSATNVADARGLITSLLSDDDDQ